MHNVEVMAPITFRLTMKRMGVSPALIQDLLDLPTKAGRKLIAGLDLTRTARQAVEQAYDDYLVMSGRVVFKLAKQQRG